ncbi:SDR family NAD(P)-dependent oxidoreductase [Rhodoligotrophos defluvii]|uniref:SDR family NAD(P)-dependent oxidoreductase n=1 Tax=Rhodoligotrophos defluvii TaxID=2561934 RepID=UPI0010C9969D|nr:3-oxoacyl-ACP reductase family protein [Rhodoligotrophos defluvii]
MGKLDGRVALVTGGQRGLGAAIVRELAAEGAISVVNYPWPLEAEAAEGLVRELKAAGREAVAMQADVTKTDEVAALVAGIRDRFGRLDILVNNAGLNPLKTWEELDRETWDATISVNLTGVFNCCKAALDVMTAQNKGNIINIASVAAFIGRGNADYIASKAALLGLTRSLARQYGKYGIRSNAISPGFHNTEMTQRARQTSAETADEFIKMVPLGFLAEADSIGKAALFLASDDSFYITGHNLVVDGGLTLR